MKVREESEKAGLKFNIQKIKIMAPSPITSWQIEGGKVEVMTDFTFLGSGKSLQTVTAATKLKDACSLKKSYGKLSILKSRDVILLKKVCVVKAMVFQ